MNSLLIIIWIELAMISAGFWEAYAEGRNAWNKKKLGWKIKIGNYILSAYHFYLFFIMFPLLLTLPLIIYGWNFKLFLILASAYSLGLILEDFTWYIVNPKVKLKELYSPFSDYYPWIKINNKKIIPWGYLIGLIISGILLYLALK